MDRSIKSFSADKIQFTITHMRLYLSLTAQTTTPLNPMAQTRNKINNLSQLHSYTSEKCSIALNTNTTPHLWKRATIIPISKQTKTGTSVQTTNPNHTAQKNTRKYFTRLTLTWM